MQWGPMHSTTHIVRQNSVHYPENTKWHIGHSWVYAWVKDLVHIELFQEDRVDTAVEHEIEVENRAIAELKGL